MLPPNVSIKGLKPNKIHWKLFSPEHEKAEESCSWDTGKLISPWTWGRTQLSLKFLHLPPSTFLHPKLPIWEVKNFFLQKFQVLNIQTFQSCIFFGNSLLSLFLWLIEHSWFTSYSFFSVSSLFSHFYCMCVYMHTHTHIHVPPPPSIYMLNI